MVTCKGVSATKNCHPETTVIISEKNYKTRESLLDQVHHTLVKQKLLHKTNAIANFS
jgi:hypothetical protein